jgi:hypothetical protein
MVKFADRKGGFPHSEICGSKGARASPHLIAACHVLHRLSTPRHPLEALSRLIVLSKTHAWGRCARPYEGSDAPTHALCLCQTMMSFIRSALPDACRIRADPSFTMSNPRSLGRAGIACPMCLIAQWWSQTGSNRRPHACKARALPTELWPRQNVTNDARPSLSRSRIGDHAACPRNW